MDYNNRYIRRWNDLIRKVFVTPLQRKRLKNKNFTLLANNCNAGFIYHDLGMQFTSPTINLFFYKDHYFTFLEHLNDYLEDELVECKKPLHKPDFDYPVCNIGGSKSLPLIELHFLHYKSFEEAFTTWNKRKDRVNLDNLFAMFSFFDDTNEDWLRRFDALAIKNKVAFVNRPFPQYKSAFYIPGSEKEGLKLLNEYVNIFGKRKYDYFDFSKWINKNINAE